MTIEKVRQASFYANFETFGPKEILFRLLKLFSERGLFIYGLPISHLKK